jgi:hypothetical protein
MGIARGTVTIMGIAPGAVTIAVGSNGELQCIAFSEQPYRHLRSVAGRQLLHVIAMGQIRMESMKQHCLAFSRWPQQTKQANQNHE